MKKLTNSFFYSLAMCFCLTLIQVKTVKTASIASSQIETIEESVVLKHLIAETVTQITFAIFLFEAIGMDIEELFPHSKIINDFDTALAQNESIYNVFFIKYFAGYVKQIEIDFVDMSAQPGNIIAINLFKKKLFKFLIDIYAFFEPLAFVNNLIQGQVTSILLLFDEYFTSENATLSTDVTFENIITLLGINKFILLKMYAQVKGFPFDFNPMIVSKLNANKRRPGAQTQRDTLASLARKILEIQNLDQDIKNYAQNFLAGSVYPEIGMACKMAAIYMSHANNLGMYFMCPDFDKNIVTYWDCINSGDISSSLVYLWEVLLFKQLFAERIFSDQMCFNVVEKLRYLVIRDRMRNDFEMEAYTDFCNLYLEDMQNIHKNRDLL
jgi:hypothetical protein